MRILVFVVAALCATTIALAQSSNQPPRPKRVEQQPQPATDSAQHPITVNVPEPDPKTTQQEAEDRAANLEVQRQIGFATNGIAVITALQLIFGIGSLLIAVRAANASKKSAEAAERSIGLARTATAFTISQKRNMDKQLVQMEAGLAIAKTNADAAKQSADTAHKALIIANPPKIIIRDVQSPFAQELATFRKGKSKASEMDTISMAMDPAFEPIGSPLKERESITASFRIMNKGRSSATIKAFDCHFVSWKGHPVANPSDDEKKIFPIDKLIPGESKRLDAPPIQLKENPVRMAELGFGDHHLHLIGVVVYADELGNLRRTGFRRYFDVDTAKFLGPDDKDWEYMD